MIPSLTNLIDSVLSARAAYETAAEALYDAWEAGRAPSPAELAAHNAAEAAYKAAVGADGEADEGVEAAVRRATATTRAGAYRAAERAILATPWGGRRWERLDTARRHLAAARHAENLPGAEFGEKIAAVYRALEGAPT